MRRLLVPGRLGARRCLRARQRCHVGGRLGVRGLGRPPGRRVQLTEAGQPDRHRGEQQRGRADAEDDGRDAAAGAGADERPEAAGEQPVGRHRRLGQVVGERTGDHVRRRDRPLWIERSRASRATPQPPRPWAGSPSHSRRVVRSTSCRATAAASAARGAPTSNDPVSATRPATLWLARPGSIRSSTHNRHRANDAGRSVVGVAGRPPFHPAPADAAPAAVRRQREANARMTACRWRNLTMTKSR